jgi:hypothetical protein
MIDRVQLVKKYLEIMDALCFIIAAISHVLLLAWVIRQIFSFQLRDYSTAGADFMPIMASIWISVLELYGCIIAVDAIADTWKWKESCVEILTVAIIVAIFIGYMKLLFIIHDSEVALNYAISFCLDGFATTILFAALFVTCGLVFSTKAMKGQILFLKEEGNDLNAEILMVMALMANIARPWEKNLKISGTVCSLVFPPRTRMISGRLHNRGCLSVCNSL